MCGAQLRQRQSSVSLAGPKNTTNAASTLGIKSLRQQIIDFIINLDHDNNDLNFSIETEIHHHYASHNNNID